MIICETSLREPFQPKLSEKEREQFRKATRRYREKHPERVVKTLAKYMQNHPHALAEANERLKEREPSYWIRRYMELRQKVIAYLGGKCVKCGFSDWRALHVDHVNGGGQKQVKATYPNNTAFYMDILKGNVKDVQLLCANCNQIKKVERKEHPWYLKKPKWTKMRRIAKR